MLGVNLYLGNNIIVDVLRGEVMRTFLLFDGQIFGVLFLANWDNDFT